MGDGCRLSDLTVEWAREFIAHLQGARVRHEHNIVEPVLSIPAVVTADWYFKDGEGAARHSAFRPQGDLQSSLVMAPA